MLTSLHIQCCVIISIVVLAEAALVIFVAVYDLDVIQQDHAGEDIPVFMRFLQLTLYCLTSLLSEGI